MKTIAKSITAAIALSLSLPALAETTVLTFTDLPYTEGTLYVAVSAGDNQITAQAIDVADETVSITIDVPECHDAITVQAFQDLNDNKRLDFDTYGRPTEPCLQTSVPSRTSAIELQLKQY